VPCDHLGTLSAWLLVGSACRRYRGLWRWRRRFRRSPGRQTVHIKVGEASSRFAHDQAPRLRQVFSSGRFCLSTSLCPFMAACSCRGRPDRRDDLPCSPFVLYCRPRQPRSRRGTRACRAR
jgi:hypothetical protein